MNQSDFGKKKTLHPYRVPCNWGTISKSVAAPFGLTPGYHIAGLQPAYYVFLNPFYLNKSIFLSVHCAAVVSLL